MIIYIKIIYLEETSMGIVTNLKKLKSNPSAGLRSLNMQYQKQGNSKFQLEYRDVTFNSLRYLCVSYLLSYFSRYEIVRSFKTTYFLVCTSEIRI